MANTLKESVRREVSRVFSPADVEYVCARLSEQEIPMAQSAPAPRIQTAVIWLSKGERKRFDHELENACLDWRDTLMAAGLAHEGWRAVLTLRGVDCDDW